jgi:titin
VQGNYIGLNASGTAAIPNGYGVQMHGGTGNVTGGTTGTTPGSCTGACNVISGNTTGIRIDAASNQSVVGNFIGTNPAGTAAIPNGVGISVQGDNNVVGGDTANERNVISGNTQDGIRLLGDTNTITGNYVGLNAAGTAGVTNSTGISVGHPSDSRSAFGNTIGGLTPAERNVVSGNDNVGIAIHGNAGANTLIGNFVGTNPAGTAEIHNGSSGIVIEADDNIIGGTDGVTPGGACTGACNLLSGNFNTGLTIYQNGTGNVIAGNMIGTDVTGTQDLGNLQGGVTLISVSGNFVGISLLAFQGAGTAPLLAGGNLISGNNAAGVQITDDLTSSSDASNNVVVGNLIGTDTTGALALPNNSEGVLILGANPDVSVSANVIEMNVISGNSTGTRISGSNAFANAVRANLIGTDISGQAPLPNGFFGIRLAEGAHDNTIGGTGAGEGNVITANGTGIRAGDPTTTGNLIQGNFIGTNAGLDAGLGNVNEGVYISNAAGNTIGGEGDGAGNVIAHNGAQNVDASGVRVQDADALANRISRNSIHSNAALGIQLDAGGNGDQEAPALSSAVNGSTHVIGTLDSAPNTTFRVEFFANSECDSSGNGEGETFLGFANVTTNGAGHAAIDVTVPTTTAAGEQVTATATDPDGNTSEFSACVEVTGSATPTPTPTPSPTPAPTPPGQTPSPTPTPTPPGQTPTPTPSKTPKPTASPGGIQGDVTCDDEANSVDSLFILREVAGLGEGACAGNGDVNCDGDRTSVDALGVLRYVAGLPVNQNEPCPDIGTAV